MDHPRLRSEVFLREDLAAIMRSILVAQASVDEHLLDEQALAYRAGFFAGLHALASAVHVQLEPPLASSSPIPQLRIVIHAEELEDVQSTAQAGTRLIGARRSS